MLNSEIAASPPGPPPLPIFASSLQRITEEEVRAFVGPRANYYWKRWQYAIDGLNRPGFNVAAFFLTTFWLLYRRMYTVTALVLGAITLDIIAEDLYFCQLRGLEDPPNGIDRLTTLVFSLVIGFNGNRWYMRRMIRIVTETRQMNLPLDQHLSTLARRGGTKFWRGMGVLLLYLLVFFALLFAYFVAMEMTKE